MLPSQPQRGGQIVLVDRGNTALTFVNPTTCAFDHQISVKGGFEKANPHDVVIVSDGKAYVTRYGKNAAPGSRIEEGDDVLMVDPRDGTVGGRIDLSTYATTDNPAAPDRAILAAGKVVVTLNRWNADFYTYAKGSVVIIDPATDRVVQNLLLGDLKNCEGLDVLPGTKTVLVACGGSYGSVEQALESGVAVIDMSTTPATLARIISGVAFATPPVTFAWVLPMPSASSPTRAFTSTMGSFTPSVPDHLYVVDYVSGGTTSFGTASPFDSREAGRGERASPGPRRQRVDAAHSRLRRDRRGRADGVVVLRRRHGERTAAARGGLVLTRGATRKNIAAPPRFAGAGSDQKT